MKNPVWQAALAAALPLLVAGCGHDHVHLDEEPEEPEPVQVTQFEQEHLLFLEYPRLVVGEEAEYLAHFSRLVDGRPVVEGSLDLITTAPDGSTRTRTTEGVTRDGIFIFAEVYDLVGEYGARMVLNTAAGAIPFELPPLVVHADLDAAFAAAEADHGDEPPDAVGFLLEQQWRIELKMEQVSRATLVEWLPAIGEVIDRPGHAAVVSPPVAGRLLPVDGKSLPGIGERVEEDELLGYIEPPLPINDAVGVLADRNQIQVSRQQLALAQVEFRAKGAEFDRTLRKANAEQEFARRSLQRLSGLNEQGLATDTQLDAARRDLETAAAAVEAAQLSRATYAETLARWDAGSDALPDGLAELKIDGSIRLPLRAPISGIIDERNHVEGEFVDLHEHLFHLVDAETVWIKARVSEFDLPRLTADPGAVVHLPGDHRVDDPTSGGAVRLVHVGAMVDSRTHTVPIYYESDNAEGRFRIGQVVDVFVETTRSVDAIAIPEQALVLIEGQPVAFVMLGGEQFQRRHLEIGIADRGRVEVKSGLEEGDRVVVRGARAIHLSALTPADAGHAHGHGH